MSNTINDQTARVVPLDGTENIAIQSTSNATQRATVSQVKDYVEGAMEQNYSLLYVSTTQVGTPASTVETTLASYTLPANTLAVDGDFIEVRASGSYGANANNKTIKVYFGSVFFNVAFLTAPNNQTWEIFARVYRTGSSSQKIYASIEHAKLTLAVTMTSDAYKINTTLSEDLTADNLIKVTGTNGTSNANDIVLEAMTVEYKKQ